MAWYYLNESGEVVGPFSEQTLNDLSAEGSIVDATLVCREGTEEWISLAEVSGADAPGDTSVEMDTIVSSAEPPHSLLTVDLESGPDDTSVGMAPENAALIPSAATRMKEGAKEGWSGIKRNSKIAALHAQIGKLRNVDLRKAHHALGKRCYDLGLLKDQLGSTFDAIRQAEATIAADRESEQAPREEKRGDALKRMTRQAARATHAQALNLKLQHLLAELGRLAHPHNEQGNLRGLEAEIEAIGVVEAQIRQMESKVENLGGKLPGKDTQGPLLTHAKGLWARLREPAFPDAEDFSIRTAVPLFVCCLGFGWVMTWLLPTRLFPPEVSFASLVGVALLAIPSVGIAFLGMTSYLGSPRRNWGNLMGALLFTMFAGIAILLFFHRVADASQVIDTRYYGKATPFILGTKLIGWLEPYRFEGNIFLRLLASIFHTGFCEEVTKLLPLFLIVVLNKKKPELPPLRNFLMVAFFSGLGFGIAEAVTNYAPWTGNPVLDSNVVRWFACVPLHAIYTVVDAAILWLLIPSFKNATGGLAMGVLLAAALVIAVVHGAYNTLSGLHILVGIILDGAAIVLMVVIVRYCTAREAINNGGAAEIEISKPRLPDWLQANSDRSPAFGRLYVIAGVLILTSFPFSSSAPRLSSPAASSFAEQVQAEFGIELDSEASVVYLMGYEIGSKANRPVPPGAFERLARQAFAMNPEARPAFKDLMLLGLEDGYNHRPNRLK